TAPTTTKGRIAGTVSTRYGEKTVHVGESISIPSQDEPFIITLNLRCMIIVRSTYSGKEVENKYNQIEGTDDSRT
ncbi:hypothetical protein PMAYCL1PPCAC_31206, partial [Pristionchus mayeri]